MKMINFELPEYAFLDSQCHKADVLQGRTAFLHIQSHTIIEALALDDIEMLSLNPEVHRLGFEYVNLFGVVEKHMLAVHYTLHEGDIGSILEGAAEWYRDYMAWEDRNIHDDDNI